MHSSSAIGLWTLLLVTVNPCGVCNGLAFPPYTGASAFFGNPYSNSPESIRRQTLEYRLTNLERVLTGDYQNVKSRLQDVERLLTVLARQECQTNEVVIELCPSLAEASMDDVIRCVVSPVAGAPAVNITRDVTFTPPFLHSPILSVSLSGQTVIQGKNCSVRVTSVAPEGFTFTFIADNLLPVQTQIVWYACPAAIFSQQQSLPGGLRELLTSGTASRVFKDKYVGPGGKIWS